MKTNSAHFAADLYHKDDSAVLEVALPDGRNVTVIVGMSDGADGAAIVVVDTNFEPDNSDGEGGLRVSVNEDYVFEGAPYEAAQVVHPLLAQ